MDRYLIRKTIGNKIRIKRKEKGFSQEKLGFLANVNRTYIGSIERGEKALSIYVAVRIANALNISVSELFEDL